MPVTKKKSYEVISSSLTQVTIKSEYDKGGIEEIKYKIATISDICEMVMEEAVNLDGCYIKEFNYLEIEKKCGKGVILNNFSAEKSFFDGLTNFKNTIFGDGDVSFENTSFGDGDIIFDEVKFGLGTVNFVNAYFYSSIVSFKKARFNGEDVSFFGTQFLNARVSFESTKFKNEHTSFKNAVFYNRVTFKNSVFTKGRLSFQNAKINNTMLSFAYTNFGVCDLFFFRTEAYKSTICFNGCKIRNRNDFRFLNVEKLELKNCLIEGYILIKSDEKVNVCVEQLSFEGSNNVGQIHINWNGIYGAKKTIRKWKNEKGISHSDCIIKNQYKMLKENFHKIGEYEQEDEAFVEYMRYYRKTKNLFTRFLLWILDFIGCYGTNPSRVACTMFGVLIFFGIAFSNINPLAQICVKVSECNLFASFYFSVITFLTIGYGDLYPKNEFTAILAVIEGFLGLFLMSYFIISLVRKTLR